MADRLDSNRRSRPIDPVFHASEVDAAHSPDRGSALVLRVSWRGHQDRRKQRGEADHEGRPAKGRAACLWSTSGM